MCATISCMSVASAPETALGVGGGVSEQAERFIPLLTVRAEVVPAAMGNDAGIAGAAWFAGHEAAAP